MGVRTPAFLKFGAISDPILIVGWVSKVQVIVSSGLFPGRFFAPSIESKSGHSGLQRLGCRVY